MLTRACTYGVPNVYLRCVGSLTSTLSYKFRSKCTALFARVKLN